MFIDSHCHLDRLDLTPFSGTFANFMAEAQRAGLDRMLCVSINLADYPSMCRLVEDYPQIDISVGVHPNESVDEQPTSAVLSRLAGTPRVVAVGETGLDYYRPDSDPMVQQHRFREHVRAAVAVGKPLIVHSRTAADDTLRVLREEGAQRVGGVFHCFTEDWGVARQAMDMNFLISFSGIVTFRNASVLQDVGRRVPADRYLIETDSPYLAPVPFRGRANYPYHVRHVAAALATLRQTDVETIAEESSRNYLRLFRQNERPNAAMANAV